jgi:hypothetical protein
MGIFDFFYLVAGLLAGIAATVGYGVLSLTPGHYRIARRAFWLASSLFASIGMVWGITSPESLYVRMAAVGIVGAISLVGLVEGLRWIKTVESPVRDESVKSAVPLLKLEASFRDVPLQWPSASIFPQSEETKTPLALRLKSLAGPKALNIELSLHVFEKLEQLRDSLKTSVFSALEQKQNGEWAIPLEFVSNKPTHTTFVGFQGENVRRIDSLDDKDGSLSIAYPIAIQNFLWLHALEMSFRAGQYINAQRNSAPAKSIQELENGLQSTVRAMTIPLPNVTVNISYTGPDGSAHQQTETIRAVFMAIVTPQWVYEDAGKQKLSFEGGTGFLGFEDKDNPDDGLFARAKHQGFLPAN